jgi:APA family basic amino acid/polyamine antiporter
MNGHLHFSARWGGWMPTASPSVRSSGLLLAILLAGFIAICTGLGGAQCGSNFPQPGGAFTWSRKLGMPTAGFVAGCCFPRKEIVGMRVNALTFAVYLQLLVPGLPVGPIAAATVVAVTLLKMVDCAAPNPAR